MTWTPGMWALVWAKRLDANAEDPQCRCMFRSSVRANSVPLRAVMDNDLFGLIQMTADLEDVEELKALVPRLRGFAFGRDR